MIAVDEIFAHVATLSAFVIFLSGLDELFVDLTFLLRRSDRRRKQLFLEQIEALPEQPIAIFVPAWHEEDVIAQMIHHTIDVLDYRRYHILVGIYDNDADTRRVVEQVSRVFRNVHAVAVGHPGPTVKADCLNSVFEALPALEARIGERFEFIVIHDAEDVVHPKTLKVFNALFPEHDFVQIPVFPLEVESSKLTAWSYADEFAVAHLRDLHVRQEIGGIVPCAGVGCGFKRSVLDELKAENGTLFPSWSLTEDYHTSVELKRAGKKVFFSTVSLVRQQDGAVMEDIVATREYFPSEMRRAIRQKARWTTGIILQSLGRVRFAGSLSFLYCLFRDRKSLVTTPIGFLAYVLFAYCLLRIAGDKLGWWTFYFEDVVVSGSPTWWVLLIDTVFAFEYILVKMLAVERLYGPQQAVLSIPRTVWVNIINFCASTLALYNYAKARITGKAIAWAKTAHAFPQTAQLVFYKKRLGELLLENRLVNALQLESALEEQQRTGERLGRVLVRQGHISEQEFVRSYAELLGLEAHSLDPYAVDVALLSRVPEAVARQQRVFPLAMEEGALVVAADDELSPKVRSELEQLVGAPLRTKLVTTSDLDFALARAYRRLGTTAMPTGARLLQAGLLTAEDLEKALRVQRETRRYLWEVLLEDGYVSAEDLSDEGTQFRASLAPAPSLMGLLPPGVPRALGLYPVSLVDGTLTLAMREPMPGPLAQALASFTHLRLAVVRVPGRALKHALVTLDRACGEAVRFGQILLRRGYLTRSELESEVRAPTGTGRLGERLLAAGRFTEEQLLLALSEYTGLPVRRVLPRLSRELASCLPEEFCRRHHLVPIAMSGRSVTVAIDLTFSQSALEEHRWMLSGRDVDLVLVPRAVLSRAFDLVFQEELRESA